MSTNWPKDWPEDAKTGPKFVAELQRRFPSRTRLVSLAEAFEELCKASEALDQEEEKKDEH